MEVLEHCPDDVQGTVLDQIAEVTAPGGTVVFSTPIEIGPTLVAKQGARALVALGGLREYETRERYHASEFLRMVLAGPDTAIPRDEYEGEDGSRFTGTKDSTGGGCKDRSSDVSRSSADCFRRSLSLAHGSTARCGSYAGNWRYPERDTAGIRVARARLPTPPRAEWAELLASADEHGVLPLLADAAAAARWDPDFLVAMRPSVAADIALSLVRERELGRVLASLAAAGIPPLLIKGAHLAFTHYRSPDRRPRLDTDLLINEKDRDGLKTCLASLGYRPTPHVTGEVAFSQFYYGRTDERGTSHHSMSTGASRFQNSSPIG